MIRLTVVPWLLFCLCLSPLTCAQGYDFDDLASGAASGSGGAAEVKGAADQANNALERQKQAWQEEAEAKRRAAEAAYQRYQAERALGNGKRYYDCEFSCRTDGFVLYDSTEKFHLKVKADEAWAAQQLAKPEADRTCSAVKVESGYMWETGLRCEEAR